jgi:hypothetical protein
MLLAWTLERASRCPECNTYYEEWDPKSGGHIHSYFPKSRTCLGCKAIQGAYAANSENAQNEGRKNHGFQVVLEKNEDTPNIRSPVTNKPIPRMN